MAKTTDITPFGSRSAEVDPFLSPFRTLDSIFGRAFGEPYFIGPRFDPAFDLDALRDDPRMVRFYKNEDKTVDANIDLPGVKKEEVKVQVEAPHTVTVSVEEREDAKDHSSHKSYRQTFTVDDHLDENKLTAKMEDGILKIHLPYREDAGDDSVKTFTVE
jgi:HSP20 family molecular chaperone IbpA